MATTPTGRHPGRPAKSIEERRRLGNPGKRAMPKVGTLVPLPTIGATMPEPMRALGREGLALWQRVWNSGATWLARDVDPDVIMVMCEHMDERMILRASVLRDGDWRQRAQLRILDAQILSTLGALGFNPSERARMQVAEVAPPSRLESLLAERQGR